jgi:hypothetical protein
MWVAYIAGILIAGLWIYHWMTKKLSDQNHLEDRSPYASTFQAEMDALEAAGDEAERWRKVNYFDLPKNVPPPPWNPDDAA